jgi:hypothetical protein
MKPSSSCRDFDFEINTGSDKNSSSPGVNHVVEAKVSLFIFKRPLNGALLLPFLPHNA